MQKSLSTNNMDIQKLSRKPSHPVRNFLKFAIPSVLLVIAIQYAVLSVTSVRKKMEEINSQVDVRLSGIPADNVEETYFGLYKEKTWLETRFQIAKTDSISMAVNLKDSLLQIELKGVVLKASKITAFGIDGIFGQLSPGAYHHLFGVQAQAISGMSTIPKEPLVIKKAPKDSTEVTPPGTPSDTVKTEAVHWMLNLDNGIVLKIEGTDRYSRSDWWIGQRFWLWQDINAVKDELRETIRFKTPVYKPEIRLVVSEADAKAIYRALPQYPLVCVRL